MLFCTSQYVLFLGAVFALYWMLPNLRARNVLLLAASFYFYAKWNEWLALLIGLTTAIDYLLARGIETSSARPRRLLFALSLAMNLSLLLGFKYANFFLASLGELLNELGASASLPVLSVLLPIGISFYTFEAINYTVDVYRGRIKAERDLASFMLFILFFPHLVAGPIVRAKDFLPQIKRAKQWSWPRISMGLALIVLGVFKKMAIADRMALYVDPVFAAPEAFSSAAVWLATLAFTLQIYCDFSGYSDIALGSAHLFGYKLTINFRMPFLAANIGDFWRRWHISLSSWLRDYLFIPLGGSRGSRWQTGRNLLIVMTLGGLWHGASWNYALWGALVGCLLILQRTFSEIWHKLWVLDPLQSPLGRSFCVALTFTAFELSMIVFRASDMHNLRLVAERMLIASEGAAPPLPQVGVWLAVVLIALGHALGLLWMRNQMRAWRLVQTIPAPAIGLAAGLLLNLALLLGPGASKAFIYFQF